MSLQASLATINYFLKNLNKNLVLGLPLPIVPWHFCDIAQCLFDIAWWIWCYSISIFVSSRLLVIFLTCFWQSSHLLTFSHHSSKFSQCCQRPPNGFNLCFSKVSQCCLSSPNISLVLPNIFLSSLSVFSTSLFTWEIIIIIIILFQCHSTFLQRYLETLDVFSTLPNNPWCLLDVP